MITACVPATWQALESSVARILRECGFEVDQGRKLVTVRSTVAIDVYAEESLEGRLNRILCECKHWTQSVPQEVVHAFRTVVGDAGANAGYIISLNGFQKGAWAAAELTNIGLVTWPEFQAVFEPIWVRRFLQPAIEVEFDDFMTYTEPLRRRLTSKLLENARSASTSSARDTSGSV